MRDPQGGVRFSENSDKALASGSESENGQAYGALYDKIPLMLFALGADGTIRSVNSHGAKELGYEPEELVGQPVSKVFHEEDRDAVRDQLGACVEDIGRVARWEYRKIRKDGSMLWVREAARAVRRDDETVVLVVCEDVTEQKRGERQLFEQRQQLRSLASKLTLAQEQERRKFATDLHDHIGQTLAMSKLKLIELSKGDLPEPTLEGLKEVCGLLDRAVEATRSLTFELGSPVLYELGLEPALESLGRAMMERYGIRFVFETDGQPKPMEKDHEMRLFRAVRELLFNIVKHARAGEARLAVRRLGSAVEISIEDDGVGFDADHAGEAVSSSGGFGLFSVRESLGNVRGRLEIESTPGSGTRIVVFTTLGGGGGRTG